MMSLLRWVTGTEAGNEENGGEIIEDMEDSIPQNRPIEANQVLNNAGGYTWKVSDLDRLRRFMCLGSESGTFYATPKELTHENLLCIARLIQDKRGLEVVQEIVKYSVEGRTAKQDSIIMALALCARQSEDIETKKAAYEALPKVCRIPTHLFMFVELCESLSKGTGWGRAHRRAICNWYNRFENSPKKLAQHVTKYRNRNGWTHLDVLRLAHIQPVSDSVGAVTRYIVKGLESSKQYYLNDDSEELVKNVFGYLDAVEKVRYSEDEEFVIQMIQEMRLVREHVPTNMLNSQNIWMALLKEMPMTAMIRNLGKMSSIGLLSSENQECQYVAERLKNESLLKEAKIHPFNVLLALKTYQSGKGQKGKLTWQTSGLIVKALEAAFYKSFKFVEPTNLRYCLALDVSGSMGVPVMGSNAITCCEAAAAMSMVTVKTEVNSEVMAFSHKFVPLNIKPNMDLDTVLRTTRGLNFGGTDCALPMIWAKQQKKQFDVFIVYTDCETWFGNVHPAEALRQYRKETGIWNARLIVCGMSSNGFTIADPEDPGMLDMVGFDSAAPEIIKDFSLGKI